MCIRDRPDSDSGRLYRRGMATARQRPELPPLFQPRLAAAQAFYAGTVLLGLQAPPFRGLGRLGGAARHRLNRRLADQVKQPLARIGAVALLGAVPLRDDDDDAVLG